MFSSTWIYPTLSHCHFPRSAFANIASLNNLSYLRFETTSGTLPNQLTNLTFHLRHPPPSSHEVSLVSQHPLISSSFLPLSSISLSLTLWKVPLQFKFKKSKRNRKPKLERTTRNLFDREGLFMRRRERRGILIKINFV